MGLKDVDFADEADGLPGSETGSAIWMPAAEEMEWLGGLQEFPQFFATGIGLSVGGHAIIQALIKTFALRSMKPGDEGRVTNRHVLIYMAIHEAPVQFTARQRTGMHDRTRHMQVIRT